MVIRRSRRSIWGVFGALALVLWLATSRNFVPVQASSPITEFDVPTSSTFPTGITAGPDGNLWFTEAGGSSKIGQITLAGTVTEFPITTSTNRVMGISTGADGNLWFTESSANKIGRITPSGTVSEFPVPSFNNLAGITNGPDGNVWFTDFDNNIVGRITALGAISPFMPTTPGSSPAGITTGPDGNIWFTESLANKIGRITPSGIVTGEFAIPTAKSLPDAITTGPDGNLWFTELGANNIGRITPSGVVTEFPAATSSNFQPDGNGIARGADGNLWFTELDANKIGRITPTGTITEFAIPTASSNPTGIASGSDGNIWFTEPGSNKIGKLALDAIVTPTPTPTLTPPSGGFKARVILPAVFAATQPQGFENGGFESGWAGWQRGGVLSVSLNTDPQYVHDGGSSSALLGDPALTGSPKCNGGIPIGQAWISQSITVPNTVHPTVSFWYWIYTQDWTGPSLFAPAYDFFGVFVNNIDVQHPIFADGNTSVGAATGCNPPLSLGWKQKSVDLTPYKGTTITLFFATTNGGSNSFNTYTYLDAVVLNP